MFEGHDPYLVALSVVIAILGGYTGFGLAARIRGTPDASHRLLLAGAAFFLAIGIWTMHFVGMLAAPLPAGAVYLVLPTIISFLICALVVGISLFFVSVGEPSMLRVVSSAVLLGVGIASMHYVGMHGLVGQFRHDARRRHGRAVGADRDRRGLWRPARLPGAAGRRAAGAERGRLRRRGVGHALHRDGRHASGSAGAGSAPPCRGAGGVAADAVAGRGVALLRDRRGFSAVAGAGSAQEGRGDGGRGRRRSAGRRSPSSRISRRRTPAPRRPARGCGRRRSAASASRPAPRRRRGLPVEGADGTHFIDTADVRSVRADAHYTKVHDGTRERMCPWSISEAEAQLDPGLFVRVHRSHIVAIPHVTFVRKEGDGAVVELDGPSPHRVPVSRAKIAEVKARLGLARRHALTASCHQIANRSPSADAFRARQSAFRANFPRPCARAIAL